MVYIQDLRLFPRNVWSLTGLKRCMEALRDSSSSASSSAQSGDDHLQHVEDIIQQVGGGLLAAPDNQAGEEEEVISDARPRRMESALAHLEKALAVARGVADVAVGASCACAVRDWAATVAAATTSSSAATTTAAAAVAATTTQQQPGTKTVAQQGQRSSGAVE